MLFGLWRRLAAVLSRFFMRILPQNIMLILLFLTVLTIVQGAGAGLGIDNLINDSRHIQQLWELNADKSLVSSIKLSIIFNSPTFWTSFFLLYTGGAIVVFSIGRRSVLTYAHRYTLWDGFKAYVMACGVYAVLLVAWITSGALQDGSGVGLRIFLGWLAASIAGFALIIALSLIMRWIFWLGYPVARGGGAAFWQIIPDIRDRARRLLVWKSANMWIVYPFFLLTFFVVTSYKLIPVIALLSLVIFVFLFVQIFLKFDLKWRYRAVLFALVVMGAPVLLGFVSVPEYKLTFEGIRGPDGEDHYAQPLDLAAPVEPVCEGGITPMQRVAAVEALDAWKARHDAVFGNGKPKLVVVATSGGAYRAGYWTAMVLDRIAWDSAPGRPLEGMAQSIRLIAGASGGMVGAGYFAALASSSGDRALVSPVEASMDSDLGTFQAPDTPWPEGTDPEDAVILDRFKTTFPVPGDSLSPVAQAMFRNDLPSLFWPTAPRLDRGKVLERQWRRMGVSYLDLFEGEQEGWRPSIVMSPTIVETGQPLLISNLDLSFMPRVGQGEVEDFFKRFPCSQDSFTLATAVRMNATFPLVSPAVSLPTRPARRVADAGYYDNYGISLVAAYLSNKAVRDWIQGKHIRRAGSAASRFSAGYRAGDGLQRWQARVAAVRGCGGGAGCAEGRDSGAQLDFEPGCRSALGAAFHNGVPERAGDAKCGASLSGRVSALGRLREFCR